MQHALRIAPYCHLCSALFYNIFSTLSHKRHDFRGKVTEHKMCVLIFCTTFVWNISLSMKNWARCDQNVYRSACNVPAIIVWNLNLSQHFRKKKSQMINFTKNRPVGAELFHAERGGGRTDEAKLVACRNFANAPKYSQNIHSIISTCSIVPPNLVSFCQRMWLSECWLTDWLTDWLQLGEH